MNSQPRSQGVLTLYADHSGEEIDECNRKFPCG